MGKRRSKSNERYVFEWTKGILVVVIWLIGAQKEVGYDDAQMINSIRESLLLDNVGEVKVKDISAVIYANLSFFETDWLRRKLKAEFDANRIPVMYTMEAVPLFDQLDTMKTFLVDEEETEEGESEEDKQASED